MPPWSRRLAAGLLALWGLPQALAADGIPQVRLVPDGPERTLFKWDARTCSERLIPDAPARAFRRDDGQMVLYAPHDDNWAMIGPTFAALRTDCRPMLRSADYDAQRMGSMWIEATYTEDGRRIAGLASQDLTRVVKERGCAGTEPGRCWLNHIIAVRSEDGGRTFAPLPPEVRTVATLGPEYKPESKGRFGVFTTSNIASFEGRHYVFMYAQGDGVQPAGNCLFRTDDPFDPTSWRGWDGSGFTVDLRPREGKPAPCRPVGPGILTHEVRSLSRVASAGVWVAVYANRLKLDGDKEPVPGFYMSVSRDLVRWAPPSRIKYSPTRARVDSREILTSYPSVLDPDSRSRNFDTIDGDSPVLLYTIQHLKDGMGTLNRDLVYVPLKVEMPAAR